MPGAKAATISAWIFDGSVAMLGARHVNFALVVDAVSSAGRSNNARKFVGTNNGFTGCPAAPAR